ncbi:MAG: alanine dehydrogenase [Archaeoglobaceae archaeon]
METMVLTEAEVRELVSMEEAIEVVEKALAAYTRGEATMPPKVYLQLENGDLRAMPARVGNYAGLKWVNSHPNNPAIGLPTVMALLILNDPKNGFPLAVMDGTYITSLRTGAAGGVAAKYLARRDSKIVGFIGCGTQARFQLWAISKIFDVERVKGYDVSRKALESFSEYCESLGVDFESCDAEAACKADIIVTSTPSKRPVVRDEWVSEGTHINAIGADAPGKQELDEKILLRAKIVVDDYEQALHSGEINVAVSKGLIDRSRIHASLGEVVTGMKPGRESEKEITVFDSTGLAIQDIAVAARVYERASKLNVLKLRFFG